MGDVSNVLFCNGAVALSNCEILIYYASSDTRLHVATTTVDKMLDYVTGTPPDGLRSRASVETFRLVSMTLTYQPRSMWMKTSATPCGSRQGTPSAAAQEVVPPADIL